MPSTSRARRLAEGQAWSRTGTAPWGAVSPPARQDRKDRAGRGLVFLAILLLALGLRADAQAATPVPAGIPWEIVVEAVPSRPGTLQEPPLLRVPLPPDQPRVGIVFRHSVEKSPVIEWFEPARPPSTGWVLVATEYESFGAGLPTEPPPGARFVELSDRFVIDGLAVPVPDLVIRPLPLTEHALLVGDERFDLTGLAPPGTALRVRIRPDDDSSG